MLTFFYYRNRFMAVQKIISNILSTLFICSALSCSLFEVNLDYYIDECIQDSFEKLNKDKNEYNFPTEGKNNFLKNKENYFFNFQISNLQQNTKILSLGNNMTYKIIENDLIENIICNFDDNIKIDFISVENSISSTPSSQMTPIYISLYTEDKCICSAPVQEGLLIKKNYLDFPGKYTLSVIFSLENIFLEAQFPILITN